MNSHIVYECVTRQNRDYKNHCQSVSFIQPNADFVVKELVMTIYSQSISEDKMRQKALPYRLKLLEVTEQRSNFEKLIEETSIKIKKDVQKAMRFDEGSEAFEEAFKVVNKDKKEKDQYQKEYDRLFLEIAELNEKIENIESMKNLPISTETELKDAVRSRIESITPYRMEGNNNRNYRLVVKFKDDMEYIIVFKFDYHKMQHKYTFYEAGTPEDQIPEFKYVPRFNKEGKIINNAPA